MTTTRKPTQILLQVRVQVRAEYREPGDPDFRRMTLPLQLGKTNAYYAAMLGKVTGWGIAHMGMFDRYHNRAIVQVVNRKALSRDELILADTLLGDADGHVDELNLKKKLTVKCQYRYDPYRLALEMQLVDFVPILNFSKE